MVSTPLVPWGSLAIIRVGYCEQPIIRFVPSAAQNRTGFGLCNELFKKTDLALKQACARAA